MRNRSLQEATKSLNKRLPPSWKSARRISHTSRGTGDEQQYNRLGLWFRDSPLLQLLGISLGRRGQEQKHHWWKDRWHLPIICLIYCGLTKGRRQEIECFKTQTHYRKSCSEKQPQRKSFNTKHRKLISRSKTSQHAMERCAACSHGPGEQQIPARCSGPAALPKGVSGSAQSYAHSCWTNSRNIIPEKKKTI